VSPDTDRKTGNRGTAVVAGATGYLGRHVVTALHADGWRVRALARDPARLREAAPCCDEVFVGHATRAETLEGLFEGADVAFSSIGVRSFRRTPSFHDVDLMANLNLVASARREGVGRFAFVSVLNGDALRRSNPLIDARERVVEQLRLSIPEAIVLRPTGFFNDIDAYFSMARRGRVWLIGDGATRINPIHGADLAALVAEILADPAPDAAYAVGGPQTFTQLQIAELAFSVLGTRPRIGHVPAGLLNVAGRLSRPFNANAAALLRMFAALGRDDAIGRAYGTRTLGAHFAGLRDHPAGEPSDSFDVSEEQGG